MLMLCLVFLPMALALGLYLLNRPQLQRQLTLAALSLALVGAVVLASSGEASISLPMAGGIGFALNGLGGLYAVVASLLWLVSAIVSRDYFAQNAAHLRRYYAALLFTYGASLGVFLAADLFTLLVCFELMSFSSYLWVIHNQTQATTVAGESYLTFAVCGGLTMLFGLAMLYVQCPDLTIATLSQNFPTATPWVVLAGFFLFVGFAIKSGVFFLHDWLPLAYTAAPAPATALLTGVLSKLGIYGIAIVAVKLLPTSITFTYFLLVLSLCNMLGGAVLAFFSGDLKRTLSFSSISQIGFILWGIALINLLGHHNAIAVYGTVFYMLGHSLAKILLFSITAIVEKACGTTTLNAIMGFGKNKPWLKLTFAIGSLSLAGVPLFTGYLGKTLLHEAVSEYIALTQGSSVFTLMEYAFLLSGGCTLAYMFKLFNCLFLKNPPAPHPQVAVSAPSKIALSSVAVALLALGLCGNSVMAGLGQSVVAFFGASAMESTAYFSLHNLFGSATSITMGVVVYMAGTALLTGKYGTLYPDFHHDAWSFQELIYKPVYKCLVFFSALWLRLLDITTDGLVVLFQRFSFQDATIPQGFLHGDPPKRATLHTSFHLSYSLAYSLLMFGLGFLFTIVYLLVVVSK